MSVRAPSYTLPPLPPTQRAVVTVALGLAVFMTALDVSIANVSIPTIAGNLSVTSQQGTWIITGFSASRAIALPMSGWLARRVGEVKLFVVSTLLFTLFSLFCGLSFSFPMLLIARVLQGAAAGPMMPLSQSLLLSNYPKERHGFANGIWAMTIVVGPVVGPILGGWITDNIHWAWIFYLNVPVGILVALLAWVLLKDRETITEKLPIDVIGLILLAFGVTALQIMLDKGSDDAWFQSSFIIVMGVIAFVALSFLVAWELTDKHPVIDLTLFKRRNFTVATLAITLGYMAYFGGIVVFPLWLQNYHGYSATWAGLAMSSLGIMAFIASPIVGRLTDRFDLRILVTAGLLIFAFLSFIKGSFNVDATFAQLFLARLPWGMGSTLFLIPLLTLSLSGLGRDRMASASGLFNFMRLLALSFGTSLSQTLWHRRSNLHDHHLTAGINAFNPAVRHWLHRAHEAGMSQMQALAHLTHSISSQASLLGLNDMYWLAGWTFLGLTVLIWFSRPEGRGRRKAPAA